MIEYLLSPEFQVGYHGQNSFNVLAGIPVHNSSVQNMFKAYRATYGLEDERFKAFCKEYETILSNVGSCGLFQNTRFSNTIFDPLFEQYVAGAIGEEDLIQQLTGKAQVYLKEQM